MLAVRFIAPGEPLRVDDVPLPQPTGDQVRIRVAGCGVCHTDLHIVDGRQARVRAPLTLGHEVAGWVDAAGPTAEGALAGLGLARGEAVLIFGGWGCGSCAECRAGSEQRCPDGASPGFQLDGGYAEAMLVPHPRHLVPLGDLDPIRAAPLADAGVTPYRAVTRVGRWLKPGARVLLIGCGGLGSFALQHLRHMPDGERLHIVVAERHAHRAMLARALGADEALVDPPQAALHTAIGGSAHVVLDMVGTDRTLAQAAENVAPDGVVMLVGEAGGTLPAGFDRLATEAWFATTAWGSPSDLRAVVAAARSGALRWSVEPMPLRLAAEAHVRLRGGDVEGRLVLVP